MNIQINSVGHEIDNIPVICYAHYKKIVEESQELKKLPLTVVNKIFNFMVEFSKEIIKKGYVSEKNKEYIISRLCKGITQFSVIKNNDTIYGQWNPGKLEININSKIYSDDFLKHIVFHEMAHCLTPTLGSNDSLNFLASLEKIIKVKKDNTSTIILHKINANQNSATTFIGAEFIKECIAEFVACDLLNYNKPKKVTIGERTIPTTWKIQYNQQYQVIGSMFLDTLPFLYKFNDKYKEFSKMAMVDNCDLIGEIIKNYQKSNNGIDVLTKMLTLFQKLVNNHNLGKNELDDLIRLLTNYKLKIEIKSKNKMGNFKLDK